MGRPPSNGGPSFRFNPVEVGEMEAILQAHNYTVPAREILEALAHRFSTSSERAGKVEVSSKQVWNWFQNRRYALRARAAKTTFPGQVSVPPPVPREDQATVRNVPQAPHPQVSHPQVSHPQASHPQAPQPQASQPMPAPVPPTAVRSMPQVPQPLPAPPAQTAGRIASENSQMEFEAKSARDGAWYDVASFLSHRSLESGDPEAMVRFAGFGPEEDEWVNIRSHIRQRSLPCESSECVAVLPGDLILCFQEGKEQALYFDAHVLDAQRRRHDVRGCRCRFLVRYDHDLSEEIVPLRKICRRPETDHRLQQLHGMQGNVNSQKAGLEAQSGNALKVDGADGPIQKQQPKQERMETFSAPISATHTNVPLANESKLPPSKIADSGNTTSFPTNVSLASESNLSQSKISDSGNTISFPTNVLPANEADVPQSKISDTGNTTSIPTNVSLANESNLQPSKIADSGTTTSFPTNLSSADDHNLPSSKIADSGNTTSIPTNVSSANESNLQPSKIADSGNTTFFPTDLSSANESNLPPSKLAGSGDTTSVPTKANESNLQPSEIAETGITTSIPTNESMAIDSNLPPSKIADSGNVSTDGNTNSSNDVAVVNTSAGSTPNTQQG